MNLILGSGCSTPNQSSGAQTRVANLENLVLEARTGLEKLAAEKSELQTQVQQLTMEAQQLRRENAQLSAEKKALETVRAEDQLLIRGLTNYLYIHKVLIDHQEEIVKSLQDEWFTKKQELFAAVGGGGNIEEFEVERAVFYEGYVVVSTLFLASHQNGSAGVTRVLVRLDPDRQYEISNALADGQLMLSPQEFAALKGNNAVSNIQRIAPPMESAKKPSTFWTEERKDTTFKAAIGLASTVASALFLKWINSSQ